ncbi:MAG TPA: helix-turn-helix domain-containing GNAT family N-acetyltransferase [Pyrinomonadaceae bacterium]|jgi:DNA-binding MarR family transcriptional regulator/N-acetylglutamate synthase-like GNAT family acetyltransferase|nr:helix-turn-helix domain-containing GNAT family N-acetyltransferase [Pyrinomonadaceae bacterium]
MSATSLQVEAVRRFNRFYTQKIGALREGLLKSPFSLAEVRVLYELFQRKDPTASELAKDLALDAGYLSRILRSFSKQGLIARRPSASDNRRTHLSLTKKGQRTFAPLNARSQNEMADVLSKLSPTDQSQLIAAMNTIERLLGPKSESKVPYIIRPYQNGDMGWIIHRHGALYAQEYKWDEQFEGLVAEIVAKFIRSHDPKRERCWIAEKEGEIVGSVFLVQRSKTVGQLRLLLVEPSARGLGIGARLVDECIKFARQAGYRKITLWTNDVLHAARHIYSRAGFKLVHEGPHHSFGHDLVEQTWELSL